MNIEETTEEKSRGNENICMEGESMNKAISAGVTGDRRTVTTEDLKITLKGKIVIESEKTKTAPKVNFKEDRREKK